MRRASVFINFLTLYYNSNILSYVCITSIVCAFKINLLFLKLRSVVQNYRSVKVPLKDSLLPNQVLISIFKCLYTFKIVIYLDLQMCTFINHRRNIIINNWEQRVPTYIFYVMSVKEKNTCWHTNEVYSNKLWQRFI